MGDGSRELTDRGLPIATEGDEGVAIAQVTSQSQPVAIYANSLAGTLDADIPLHRYWGSAEGFSTEARSDIQNISGYKSSVSNLDSDGHVDLIVINASGEFSKADFARIADGGANIYWGGDKGSIRGPEPTRFDPDRRQILRESGLGSINVADLNGDGFLDVLLGSFEYPSNLVIYYGSPAGLLLENRMALRVPERTLSCLIADFNRDGDLDIIVRGYQINQIFTYWGVTGRYSENNKTILPHTTPIDQETADLNNDGWLDLIVAGYNDPLAEHHDIGLSISWGRTDGWRQAVVCSNLA